MVQTTDWFSRPLLLVRDVEASLAFYVETLGFTEAWRFEDGGELLVAEVGRLGASAILTSQWPDRVGKGVLFISINAEPETPEAVSAALDALKAEFEAKGASVREGRWGYRLLVVEDLDGNELLFPYPNEPG